MSNIQEINCNKARVMLKNNQAIIIDVREQDEWDESHINQAHHHALSEFDPEYIKNINPDNKIIIMQCRSGMRSQTAIQYMQESGYAGQLYNLTGGILAWNNQE